MVLPDMSRIASFSSNRFVPTEAARCLLRGGKATTALPAARDHVLIQFVHREERLFPDGSVVNVCLCCVCERGRERQTDTESEGKERMKEGPSESIRCTTHYTQETREAPGQCIPPLMLPPYPAMLQESEEKLFVLYADPLQYVMGSSLGHALSPPQTFTEIGAVVLEQSR